MSLKKDFSKVEYRIKLLSGNNVVLVEANGFESEIFVPEIQNGRISFQNIIPNRRCCYMGNVLSSKNITRKKRRSIQLPNEKQAEESKRDSFSPPRVWRLYGGNELNRTRSPLAASTPAPAPSPTASFIMKHHIKYNKENYEPRQQRSLAQAYHTMELLRTKGPTPMQIEQKTYPQAPGTKTVRIQCEQAEIDEHLRAEGGGGSGGSGAGNRNGAVSVATGSRGGSGNSGNGGNGDVGRVASADSGSDFNVPDVPNLTPSLKQQTPTCENKSKAKNSHTSGTVTKWRKCITPIRTYSRHAINVPCLPTSSSGKKPRLLKKVPSATQGTKGTHKIEVKRRKLVIDNKTAISPHTFKQQQNSIEHLRPRSAECASAATLPKERKRYDASKKTAFDMLTSPFGNHAIAAKLQQQFKKACVNKAASTCPKYKILCKLPPLEHTEKSKLTIVPSLPPSNITAVAMMEKACSSAIRMCSHAGQHQQQHASARMRWSSQQ